MTVVKSQMYRENNTSRPCRNCKWETPDPTDPNQGQCTVNRTAAGAVWKRWVRDAQNMTCSRYEEGKLSFREHV
ncbi:Benzylsuccinate synthase beta subunit [Desulfosarcina cetonica]|uniref:benzylsuccinate synthase beta subunit family protein n=1 Tax=Desulfosarcina cetonica TaxID=90730 RepID=UPI0006CF697E|nr:benzylsuccinate synthase beta subunit family protein [Desulfosarcina cetonica]VTR71585.1 Benzylsuccinate synthase beta subunit [Desulfosarcina cetonica]